MSELADLSHRVNETVQRIARLLKTDADRFAVHTVREAFVAADTPATPDAVAALKARTVTAADEIAQGLHDAVLAVPWLTLSAIETSDPPRITDVPAMAQAVETMSAAVRALLADAGLTAEVAYQLPQRFIDHDALPTLTRTLFKTLARHATVRAEDEARRVARSTEARRQLWEDA